MKRHDRRAMLLSRQRRVDSRDRVVAAQKVERDGNRYVRDSAREGDRGRVFGWRFGAACAARKGDGSVWLRGGRHIAGKTRAGVNLTQPIKIATLERREQGRCIARFDEHRPSEIRPLADRGPFGRIALPVRIVLGQIVLANNQKHVIRFVVALLHPCRDIPACGNLPLMDTSDMAERLELLPDPKRPVPVAAGIADENIRHAPLRLPPLAHHRPEE